MTFEINTESKTVMIKSHGHTFKEIEKELNKILGKDWKDYSLSGDNAFLYIPYIPNSYPWIYQNTPYLDAQPYVVTPSPTVTTVSSYV